jgi:myo-inositol-1(or 4)-monophosphatase
VAAPDPDDLVAIAERLATDAGALLAGALDERGTTGSRDADTKSSATDHVTEWDHASERLIRGALADLRPDDAILGEEGGGSPGTSGVQWIVDPIDGTTNFLYGLPPFAVSIAAAYEGRVLAGAVADVLHGELFSAAVGAGARRNGVPLAVSTCTDLALALVATGFAYDADRRRAQAQVLVSVLPRVRDLRRPGAASVDLCWVACGRLDAYWERGLAPWDFAAGALIASEAGAVLGDLAGGPPSTDFVVASTPGVADAFADLLRGAGAGEA